MFDSGRGLRFKASALFLSCALSLLISSGSKAESGFVCLQSSSSEARYRTIITSSGIRVERDGSKAYLIAKAPTWRVVFYNPANSKAIDMTYDQWIHHESFWTPLKPDTLKPNTGRLAQHVENIGQIKYANRMCGRYGMLRAHERKMSPDRGYWGEIYGPTVPKIPKQPLSILEKLFEMPEVEALPLFAKEYSSPPETFSPGDPRALIDLFHSRWNLKTASIIDQEISQKLFTYPTKFLKVERECDVLFDETLKEKATDAIDLMH